MKTASGSGSPAFTEVLRQAPQQPGFTQIGFIIPAGSLQAYINAKAYWEFDGHDRTSGWNTWLTLSLSPAPPSNPRSAMLTKKTLEMLRSPCRDIAAVAEQAKLSDHDERVVLSNAL
jgi:hypothetical protein